MPSRNKNRKQGSRGAAAYSETAQVYLAVNYDYGITLSAVSMTPKSFAEFDRVFSKEDEP